MDEIFIKNVKLTVTTTHGTPSASPSCPHEEQSFRTGRRLPTLKHELLVQLVPNMTSISTSIHTMSAKLSGTMRRQTLLFFFFFRTMIN
ncbi:hypothetical protein SK128_028489 [Halocaridina rubra]|uniref:Uncharacterized protein n=1 Tax=Halocaridina rubra TaxID=373956 RepID=A0AAN8WNC0_HALRR